MATYKASRILREGFTAITLSVMISTFAGTLLNVRLESLITVPVILILIPPFNDMAGDFGCIIGARLATALHLGIIKPRIEKNTYLFRNIIAIIFIAIISSIYLSILVYAIGGIMGLNIVSPISILILILISSILLALIIIAVGVIVAFISYIYHWDPDNTTIPILTAIGDFTGILTLIYVASLIHII
ncbi:MAG: magnesium transporter [Candidatus Methanomethylicia archaeon]